MPLVKCLECGSKVSDQAATCPKCGAPVTQATVTSGMEASKRARILGVMAVAIIGIGMCSMNRTPPESPPAAAPKWSHTQPPAEPEREYTDADRVAWASILDDRESPAANRVKAANDIIARFAGSEEAERATALLPALQREADSRWRYETTSERMDSGTVRTARIYSTNTLNFDFPYNGPQHGSLVLRRHPKHGKDVLVSIEKGQILCSSYGDCRIRVRFDDGQPITVRGNPPADHSSETVFITMFDRMMQRLPDAKVVRVEFDAFRQGTNVLEFNVEGFNADRMR